MKTYTGVWWLLLVLGILVVAVAFALHGQTANAGVSFPYRYVEDFACTTGWSKDTKTWHGRVSYVSGFKDNKPVCTELEIVTMGSKLSWQEQTSEDGSRVTIIINEREK